VQAVTNTEQNYREKISNPHSYYVILKMDLFSANGLNIGSMHRNIAETYPCDTFLVTLSLRDFCETSLLRLFWWKGQGEGATND